MLNVPETINFTYRFKFPKKPEKIFSIRLKQGTLSQEFMLSRDLPSWTKLGFHQCPNCPLDKNTQYLCPVATNLVKIIELFSKTDMEEEIDVVIETKERTCEKRTPLKTAVSSLIGLCMVTSGCPILDQLRPQARFHLPFASVEETLYRSLTMYLTAQYLRQCKGLPTDWQMSNLSKTYTEIAKVNTAFVERLKKTDFDKTSIDALLKLDCFAYYINLSLNGKTFSDIEHLYTDYLKKNKPVDILKKPETEAAP